MTYISKISLIEEQFDNIFYEDIYSNKAMVYHRTSASISDLGEGLTAKNLLAIFFKRGFKINKVRTNTHGYGFYSYFDLNASNESKSYGNIIYRFQISSLNKFIYLNYEEFSKTNLSKVLKNELNKKNNNKDYSIPLNEDNFIKNQMLYYDFDKNEKFKNFKITNDQNKDSRNLYEIFGEDLYKLINGMIFNKILIAYKPQIIIPISYSDDDGKVWKKINVNDDNKDRLLKRSRDFIDKNENQIKDTLFINNAKISADSKYKKSKAGKNAKVATDSRIIWEKGKWINGDWKHGTWLDGNFINGKWEDGVWKHGKFGINKQNKMNDPLWIKGTWESGKWQNGIWKYGTWEGGDFINGTWEDGVWKQGYFGTNDTNPNWKNGTWEDGHFINGVWEDGTWLDGNFIKGIFSGRTWNDGVFGKPNINNKPDKSKNAIFNGSAWEKGIWWGGIWKGFRWNGGKWYGGYDKNGNWHGEDDSPDKWEK